MPCLLSSDGPISAPDTPAPVAEGERNTTVTGEKDMVDIRPVLALVVVLLFNNGTVTRRSRTGETLRLPDICRKPVMRGHGSSPLYPHLKVHSYPAAGEE